MPDLSSNSGDYLLRLARLAIEKELGKHDRVAMANEVPEELHAKRGCFVTLKKGGQLRGCVGIFRPEGPLWENVQTMAAAAAFEDFRFPPVAENELSEIRIEISVLGDLEQISSSAEIEIGKHGVYVQHEGKSGTYLPDVAVETGWQVEEFLEACALDKAGLKLADIKKAEYYRYEVKKFYEKK